MQLLFVAALFLGIRASFKGMIMASGSTGIIFVSALAYVSVAAIVGFSTLYFYPGVNGALLGVILLGLVEMTEAAILGTAASYRFDLFRAEAQHPARLRR